MDSSDIIEVLITVGVVFVSVIGSLVKERAKGRKHSRNTSSKPVARRPAVPQPRAAYSLSDDWIEMNGITDTKAMPGDYYGKPGAQTAAEPVSLTEPAELPLEPMELPETPATDQAAPVADTPERRRLIDNLIMGEILARKF